ncbi:hypothetical protein Y032_0001g117 [Ancylostoma ceylanicum]|uniref:Uncharacterized protein n=1 Tax=Ancylostoma ceylanicum TaxID=53326 RepID=A0A016W2F7_9BILA|nr:hypothetical protein Y032_0001g117 [Ancylostoma ceylanicum]
MLDDQFRMRVDTGCTADSRDSGIDVRSRSRIIPKRAHRLGPLKPVMEDAEEPKWDVSCRYWINVLFLCGDVFSGKLLGLSGVCVQNCYFQTVIIYERLTVIV